MKKLQAGQGLLSLILRPHLTCISLPVQCVVLKGIHTGVGLGSGAETGNENDKFIHLKHLPAVFLVCAHLLLPVLLLLKLRVRLLSSLVCMILTHSLWRGGATLTYGAVRFCWDGSICIGTDIYIVVHVGSVVVLLFIMQAMELEDAGKHCQSLHIMESAKVVKPVHEYVGQDDVDN